MQRRFPAIALAALVSGCATVQPLEVRVIALEPAESLPLEQRMTLGLRLVNPNDREIVLTGMSLNLTVNDQPLARGVSDATVTVPRLGEAVARITVGTSLFDVARQLFVLDAKRSGLKYGIDGRIYLGGARSPMRFESSGTLGASAP
jgi:LEA14-like dessication related protein